MVPDVNTLSRLETLILPCSEPDTAIWWLVPSLKTLRLFISEPSSLQLSKLLAALTGLKKLEILGWRYCEVDFPESEDIFAKAIIPTLRRLDLNFESVSNWVPLLLDLLVIAPTRVSFHVDELEDENPLHVSFPIMMDVGEKLRTTLSHPGMPRIEIIHMYMPDNSKYYLDAPEVSVQGFPSQPFNNEPVLTLGMQGREAIKIFMGGFVEKFPFEDVTCLSLSYGVDERIFRDMSPVHWHGAFRHMKKVQMLILHGSPPQPLLTALRPLAPVPDGLLLFPQLSTLHLRGVDFYSLDRPPDGVRWCIILRDVLAARKIANKGLKRLLVWKCFNFPIHYHLDHQCRGYTYGDLVESVVWDKLRMVKSS